VERRGRVTESGSTWVNWQQEEPDGLGGRRRPSTGGTSRVTGDGQARICERLGAKFPGPTRQQETEPSQTGLRRRRESFVNNHRETKSTAPVLDSLSSFVVGTVSELETEQKSGPKFKAGCDRPECCVAVKPARPTTDGSIPLV